MNSSTTASFLKKNRSKTTPINGCKIGVACLIGSRVSKTSYEITAVQLKKHYLMKSMMLIHCFIMFCINVMASVFKTVFFEKLCFFNVTICEAKVTSNKPGFGKIAAFYFF